MVLVPHWRRVLLRAWSLWPVYLATLLEIAALAVPYVDALLPRWLVIGILVLPPILRIFSQGDLHAGEPYRQD